MNLFVVALIGVGVGFLGGMFGKGGSAVATPLLHAAGVPAIVAVAGPLPATIPSTLVASWAYWRAGLLDRRIVTWTVAFGVPATVAGALATQWVDGSALVIATEVILIGLGARFLLVPSRSPDALEPPAAEPPLAVLAGVAVVVGVLSGLLANSGGFLLAPLFVMVLRLPLKEAFASSLAVAAALAVPGTIVHTLLGHVDWTLVAVFGSTSVPLSFLGARVAIATDVEHLERLYGAALVVLGTVFLVRG